MSRVANLNGYVSIFVPVDMVSEMSLARVEMCESEAAAAPIRLSQGGSAAPWTPAGSVSSLAS